MISHDENDRINQRVGVLHPVGDNVDLDGHAFAVGVYGPADYPWKPECDQIAGDKEQCAEYFFVFGVVVGQHHLMVDQIKLSLEQAYSKRFDESFSIRLLVV